MQPANPAVSDQLASRAEMGRAALLRADLQNSAGLMHHASQLLALVDRKCQRLLGVEVFSCPAGIDIDLRMPVIRRRIADDVDVRAFKQLAVVLIDLRSLAQFGFDRRRRPLGFAQVRVADSDQIGTATKLVPCHRRSAAANADDGRNGPIVFGRLPVNAR